MALSESITDSKIPARVGVLNRVGIPHEIRSLLGVREGDYVVFLVRDGKIVLEKL